MPLIDGTTQTALLADLAAINTDLADVAAKISDYVSRTRTAIATTYANDGRAAGDELAGLIGDRRLYAALVAVLRANGVGPALDVARTPTGDGTFNVLIDAINTAAS